MMRTSVERDTRRHWQCASAHTPSGDPASTLEAKRCPACPDQTLEFELVDMFHPDVSGTCRCCGSLWILVDETVVLIEQGPRLRPGDDAGVELD